MKSGRFFERTLTDTRGEVLGEVVRGQAVHWLLCAAIEASGAAVPPKHPTIKSKPWQ
jgi:hypothetical protein